MAGDFIFSGFQEWNITHSYYSHHYSLFMILKHSSPRGPCHADSRPKQIPVTTLYTLYTGTCWKSQVIQNTGLTARGSHIHGSGQEPVKDFHGSPGLVSYGPPSHRARTLGWVGFFFFSGLWIPLRNLAGDISDSGYDSAVATSPVLHSLESIAPIHFNSSEI